MLIPKFSRNLPLLPMGIITSIPGKKLSNMVRKRPIIREIFKGDHNAVAAAARKLK